MSETDEESLPAPPSPELSLFRKLAQAEKYARTHRAEAAEPQWKRKFAELRAEWHSLWADVEEWRDEAYGGTEHVPCQNTCRRLAAEELRKTRVRDLHAVPGGCGRCIAIKLQQSIERTERDRKKRERQANWRLRNVPHVTDGAELEDTYEEEE